ncbi:(R)-1-hydroxy-2-aminoethylphosphonate ammonia-lyase [Pontibacillus salipaludis]|uniref:(R)-1-hydroxy-2-aminoethylphosphonate ammonia-lyase n=1 Tax=Pontibacillus salipaludis TaxID=1697394 RepID=UPI0031EAE15E
MFKSYLYGEGDSNHSPLRRKHFENQSRETQEWLIDDQENFFQQSLSTPCLDVVEEAKGPFLTMIDGKVVYDFHGNAVHQVGFGHPRIIEAMKEQLDTLSFSTRRYTNKPAIRLGKKLAELAPGSLSKCLFAPGATSAIGMALKLARFTTGKYKTISMWESFHGASMDALSVGGEAHFRRQIGPLLPGAIHVPPIQTYRPLWEGASLDDRQLANYIEYIVKQDGEVGAFVMEPIRNTDVQMPSKAFMKQLRAICTEHNIKLIFDETAIGLGRTGQMFAFEHYGIEPDMVVLGKGLGGGAFPMAALLADQALDQVEETSLGHYTHEKSPVGATAALTTIEVIEEEGLLERSRQLECMVRDRLETMKESYSVIGDVRGVGLLFGIELVKDRDTKEKAREEADRIMHTCLQNGLSFKVSKGNVLQLCPPLTITEDQLTEALDILEQALLESENGKES